ncbi:RNA-directed DNA polymerase (Reverse transcriptase), partial [Trifolium medium]|nr:RNA-directed DNA polymerase (Reverse transcriptase) [Trifolium medium]
MLDGVLIANELVEEAKRRGKETILFKVDFEKAYDSVNWNYLDEMMMCMGFCDQWRRWIAECLNSASVSVLVNGSPTKEFRIGRGLRQGDPLSPFLFLIAAEGLGMLMNKAATIGRFVGYEFGNQGVRLSQLQFADDTLIMGPSTMENVAVIKATLHLFELILGLKVNFHKSRLVGIKVSTVWVREAAKVLNCKVGVIP